MLPPVPAQNIASVNSFLDLDLQNLFNIGLHRDCGIAVAWNDVSDDL